MAKHHLIAPTVSAMAAPPAASQATAQVVKAAATCAGGYESRRSAPRAAGKTRKDLTAACRLAGRHADGGRRGRGGGGSDRV